MRRNLLNEIKQIWREYEEHYVLVRIISILYQKVFQFDIDVRAAAVAYNFTLAVFPTILFLFSLLPYLPIDHLDLKTISFIKATVPKNLQSDVTELITEIITKKRGGVLLLPDSSGLAAKRYDEADKS